MPPQLYAAETVSMSHANMLRLRGAGCRGVGLTCSVFPSRRWACAVTEGFREMGVVGMMRLSAVENLFLRHMHRARLQPRQLLPFGVLVRVQLGPGA